MRQRSLTQRFFTALLGLWFSFLVAEPVPVHVCPMHDGMPQPAAAQHAPDGRESSHASADHVGMQHAPESHGATSTHDPVEHEAHLCLCLGCCAGTAVVSLPPSPVSNLEDTLRAMQVRRVRAHDVLVTPVRFAFALPFANGPPVG
jgi:hypothetical protein